MGFCIMIHQLLQFNGHGYVGDWVLSSLPNESNSNLSCTQRFASNGLLMALLKNEDYDYKTQDDLGLFYCLLDIFFNGHLPWYCKACVAQISF